IGDGTREGADRRGPRKYEQDPRSNETVLRRFRADCCSVPYQPSYTFFGRRPPSCGFCAFEQLNAIANSVEAELTQLTCFRISAEDAKYFTARRLFGEEVATKFVPANQDIEEAGKCLALSRGTATVFHLMRVMEAGLKALAKPLGIPYAP